MSLNPFADRLKTTFFLKSGKKVVFYCDEITCKRDLAGDLTDIIVKGQKRWPLYIRISDISAIQNQKVWRPFT